MERRIYVVATALLAIAGLALVMHVLGIKDSIPALIPMRGRHYASRDDYVRRIVLDAIFLPLLCALFGYVAHLGRQIDLVSWFFVAGFYAAFWWLSWEANHSYQTNLAMPEISVGSVTEPTYALGLAIVAGLGFWKFKQEWSQEE